MDLQLHAWLPTAETLEKMPFKTFSTPDQGLHARGKHAESDSQLQTGHKGAEPRCQAPDAPEEGLDKGVKPIAFCKKHRLVATASTHLRVPMRRFYSEWKDA